MKIHANSSNPGHPCAISFPKPKLYTISKTYRKYEIVCRIGKIKRLT